MINQCKILFQFQSTKFAEFKSSMDFLINQIGQKINQKIVNCYFIFCAADRRLLILYFEITYHQMKIYDL